MQSEHLTQKEIYEMLRAQIEHEDRNIDGRVNWLLASQGFLLISFTTALTLVADRKLSFSIVYVIAAIAIILNLFGLMGVLASFLHLADLVRFWKSPHPPKSDKIKAVRNEFPPLLGETKYYIFNGGYGSTLTPIVLGIAWILLVVFVRF